MNILATIFAPAIAFLKANAVILFIRWMPFLFFAITVGVAFAFDTRIAFVGSCLVIVSTITLILDVEGKLPPIKLPPNQNS